MGYDFVQFLVTDIALVAALDHQTRIIAHCEEFAVGTKLDLPYTQVLLLVFEDSARRVVLVRKFFE